MTWATRYSYKAELLRTLVVVTALVLGPAVAWPHWQGTLLGAWIDNPRESRHKPAVLVLSRQALPTFDRTTYASATGVARGAYVLADAPGGLPDVLLLATGSEVHLCVAAHEHLVAKGIRSRVVSMPSWELFDDQPQEYRDAVLPPAVTARVSVEQASSIGWERYVGPNGRIIAMTTFGASAPVKALQRKFGFEPDLIAAAAEAVWRREKETSR